MDRRKTAMHQARLPFYHSITFQLTAALLALLVLFAGALGYSLYLAEERERDQVVINTAARLELVARMMRHQALNYLAVPARDYATYDRDVRLYYQDLRTQMDTFDTTLGCFTTGRFAVPHNPDATPAIYTFDSGGHPAVAEATRTWKTFRGGLSSALGDNASGPRLEYAAQYIMKNVAQIEQAAATLSEEFAQAAHQRLAANRSLNRWVVGVALVLLVWTVWWAQRTLRPLAATMQGFRRVAQGEFNYTVPATSRNEIGVMVHAFNSLTARLQGLFQLVDRTQESRDIGSCLQVVADELSTFLPVDWAGALLLNPDGTALVLEHAYSRGDELNMPRRHFSLPNTHLAKTMEAGVPLRVPDVPIVAGNDPNARFMKMLGEQGLETAFFVPIEAEVRAAGVLVFASRRPHAYLLEHEELMGNLAGLVSHGFRKTAALENLVVSAVGGLAKLAESRDPETGDHLVRMSLYAAIIAEQLSSEGPYREQVTPKFVRDVYRFAPMHDIGKVGILDHVLLKPGDYTDKEREVMNRHPMIGGAVLRQCEAQMERVGYSIFTTGIEIAEGHHEKFDGSGYPRGVAGEAIPLSARVVTVADVFDALTSKRPYKEAWSVDDALAYLSKQRGMQFDPAVIDAFDAARPRIMEVYERHKHV
ncbi:MAG: HD domain-containing protein [Pseudomonadota bacterium]|nr:MAG: HD domain-containing protein [Pseudomonadota bacterium]